jgi:hypothetical protein
MRPEIWKRYGGEPSGPHGGDSDSFSDSGVDGWVANQLMNRAVVAAFSPLSAVPQDSRRGRCSAEAFRLGLKERVSTWTSS